MTDLGSRLEGIFVADRNDFVVYGRIQNIRHKSRADSLNLVASGMSL